MPIPAVGEIFAAFSRHPLADHDPRYESFVNGLNNNIAAYIFSGTDKDCLLNDDATGFHDDAIDTLREAVISLFSVYEEEFVASSNANWGAVTLLLRPALAQMTFAFEFFHQQMGAIRRPGQLWKAFEKTANGRNTLSNMIIHVKLDNVFLAPSPPGTPVDVFNAHIYTRVNVPVTVPPTSGDVAAMIGKLTLAMADTNTKMGLATDSQKDMADALNLHLKNTALSSNSNPSLLATYGVLVLNNFSKDAQARYAINSDTTVKITKNQLNPFYDHRPTTTTSNRHYKGTGLDLKYNIDITNLNRIILRTGHFIDMTPQGRDGEKTFLNNVPICTDESGPAIRSWYNNFGIHCASAGIYLHPYYLFDNCGDPRGFTIGDDEDDDLPSHFRSSIERMDGLIHSALTKCFKYSTYSKTKNFSMSVTQNHGHGYQALIQIVMQNHPSVIERPSILCRNRPSQEDDSIQTYFRRYDDFLELRAFTEDNHTDLNHPGEIDAFIDGLKYSDFLHSVSRLERQDPSKQYKFTPGTIVPTLTAYLAYDESPSKVKLPSKKWIPSPKTGDQRSPYKKWSHSTDDAENIDQVTVEMRQLVSESLDEEFYEAVIHQVQQRPDLALKRPCLVCTAFKTDGQPVNDDHLFKDCPVLNNHELLKTIHIQYCSGNKRMANIRNEALTKLNQICIESKPNEEPKDSDFQED